MPFALVLAAVFACEGQETKDDEEDDNQFREDVIQCEEAIARLERCCPDFDASRVLCNYYYSYDTGCGSTTEQSVHPALDLSESRCVRDTSCQDLVARGVCGRAEQARAYSTRRVADSDGGLSTSEKDSHPPVCP